MSQLRNLGEGVAKTYFQLFVNRKAYAVQSIRPNQKGRHYYTKADIPLTLDVVRHHLEGTITIALYAIKPTDQTCKWCAVDADYPNAIVDLVRMRDSMAKDGVVAALENSRRGGHLWIFFETPQLARDSRLYLIDRAMQLGIPIQGVCSGAGALASRKGEGVEIFPKQSEVRPGEYGNAMRGPLGIHQAAKARFSFIGGGETLVEQINYLAALKKVAGASLRQLIAGKTMPGDGATGTAVTTYSHPFPSGQRIGFQILDHIPVHYREEVGRNYIARCPSCAESGHDQSGDNLSISILEPWKYRCWRDCTKEEIRRALGFPVPARRSA